MMRWMLVLIWALVSVLVVADDFETCTQLGDSMDKQQEPTALCYYRVEGTIGASASKDSG